MKDYLFFFRIVLTIAVIILSQLKITAQFDSGNNNTIFEVDFDFSSVEEIFQNPGGILNNPDDFWKHDSAYVLAKSWHESTQVPERRKEWEKNLQKLAKASPEKIASHKTTAVIRELRSEQEKFMDMAIPHIISFFPEQTPEIKTKIFFTAYTVSWGFATNGQSVISITDKHYHNNPEFILNLLIHEMFHVGYGENINLRKEEKLTNKIKHSLIAQLHNEGLATYVAYTGQNIYSANGYENDFKMLDNPKIVQKKIEDVNEIFSNAESEDISSLSWKTGIMKRAYYVTGAYMAKVIDEKLGRHALVKTIEYGPRLFINTYNSLVGDEQKIIEL